MTESTPPTRHLCVVGDVHGRLQLALLLAARWQEELGVRFDAVLLAGDVGVFPDVERLDKATRRHAKADPTEIEFATQWMAGSVSRHLDRIFLPTEEGGCGLLAPVVMVCGNHEDFEYLETLVPSRTPRKPVAPAELPCVDPGRRLRLLPSGWRVQTATGLTVAGVGGIQRDQRQSEYHPGAYFTHDHLLDILNGPRADLLVTHTGPNLTQPFPLGATELDVLADGSVTRTWCHGHSVQDDAIVEHRGVTVVPLHDCTFGKWPTPGSRGLPHPGSMCHLAFSGDTVRVQRGLPASYREFNRRAWVTLPDGRVVAPQLL